MEFTLKISNQPKLSSKKKRSNLNQKTRIRSKVRPVLTGLSILNPIQARVNQTLEVAQSGTSKLPVPNSS